jgi:hypothetical protein
MEGASPLKRPYFLSFMTRSIDFIFCEFDCQHSTYPRHTGFVFAVAEFYFPSPTAIGQLDNGVFYSLMFHRIISLALVGGRA